MTTIKQIKGTRITFDAESDHWDDLFYGAMSSAKNFNEAVETFTEFIPGQFADLSSQLDWQCTLIQLLTHFHREGRQQRQCHHCDRE